MSDSLLDAETWSLDVTIANFILPRLRRFKELNNGYPDWGGDTWESWNEKLDTMIDGFSTVYETQEEISIFWPDEEAAEKLDKALSLLAKHFRDLWW